MKKTLRSIALTLLVVGILIAGLQGRAVPINKSIYQKVGRFSLRPYKYGIYLTQIPSGVFYNFSPHNDYYLDDAENEVRLVDPKSLSVNEEASYIYQNKSLAAKLLAIRSYLGLVELKTTFETAKGPVTYQADISENKVTISILDLPQKSLFNKVVMTMSLNATDQITETTEHFVVSNPKTPGVIRIQKGLFPDSHVSVNTEKGQFEFEVTSKDPKIELELFDSLEEIT